MSKVIEFIDRYYTYILLLLAVFVVTIFVLDVGNESTKRAAQEARITELTRQVAEHKQASAVALARADEIEKLLNIERDERSRLVEELGRVAIERKQEGTRYGEKRAALDSITDFDTLRRVDCELRAKLGYDCAETLPRGTTDRPDGARTATPPQ